MKEMKFLGYFSVKIWSFLVKKMFFFRREFPIRKTGQNFPFNPRKISKILADDEFCAWQDFNRPTYSNRPQMFPTGSLSQSFTSSIYGGGGGSCRQVRPKTIQI